MNSISTLLGVHGDEFNGHSTAAHDAAQSQGERQCAEVTASLAPVNTGSAESVNPAISLAISPASDENYITESKGNKPSNQSGTSNEKPNCYECNHRGGLSYSAHSQCNHPALEGKGKIIAVACILSRGAYPPLGVTGNRHGIANGWFSWPLDFDPVWLDSCGGFSGREPINEAPKVTERIEK